MRRTRHTEEGGPREWSLPKGHVNEGESLKDAARREVEEETRWRVAVGPLAGKIRYPISGQNKDHPEDAGASQRKIVFWHMNAITELDAPPRPCGAGGNGEGAGAKEVAEVAWLRPRQAIARLTYAEQADLVIDHLRPYGGAPGKLKRLSLGSGKWRYRRLEQALAIYRVQFEAQVDPTNRGPGSSSATAGDLAAFDAEARRLLDASEEALSKGDLNGGWEALFAAKEREILIWGEADVAMRSIELLEEADAKLKDHWRGKSIHDLLDWSKAEALGVPSKPEIPLDEKRERLARATQLRNEHFSNKYRRIDQIRDQLILLAIVSTGILATLIILLSTGAVPLDAKDTLGGDQILGVALFGALGGAFSGSMSLLQSGPKGIPEGLAAGWTTLMRPVVGAVGALAAYAFLFAGILGIDAAQAAYAVGFAAGFSERLVSQAAETLAG